MNVNVGREQRLTQEQREGLKALGALWESARFGSATELAIKYLDAHALGARLLRRLEIAESYLDPKVAAAYRKAVAEERLLWPEEEAGPNVHQAPGADIPSPGGVSLAYPAGDVSGTDADPNWTRRAVQ